jgi:chromosome partitioning protein
VRGYGPKQLLGIPWRVAFALQADGWYPRQDIIWHRAEEFPAVLSIQPTRLQKALQTAGENDTHFVVLDTAPHAESTALDAARAARLVLIPCRPAIMDIRAVGKTINLLKLAGTSAYAVLNAVPPKGSVVTEAGEAIENLGLPVCPVRVGQRVAYSHSLIDGRTAQETEPEGKAAEEVQQLYTWTCAQLGMSARAQEHKRHGKQVSKRTA